MKILCLSGGSNRGAYEAGAIKYLMGDLGLVYDAFVGISIGSINAAYLSQFPTGQEKKAVDSLLQVWATVSKDKVIKNWFPFGELSSLWKTSLFDSSPLENWIHTDLNIEAIRKSGKICSVGSVSLNTGNITYFDQNYDNFSDAVIASASFPSGFKPVPLIRVGSTVKELFIDGGLRNQLPLSQAIALGATEVDIVSTSPDNDNTFKPTSDFKNTIDILGATISTMSDQIIKTDLKVCQLYNQLAQAGLTDKKYVKLNFIRPAASLITDSFDFTQISIQRMLNLGYEDAKKQYK